MHWSPKVGVGARETLKSLDLEGQGEVDRHDDAFAMQKVGILKSPCYRAGGALSLTCRYSGRLEAGEEANSQGVGALLGVQKESEQEDEAFEQSYSSDYQFPVPWRGGP